MILPRRALLAALVGPGLGLIAVVPAVLWWGRLPDPLATQWGVGGHPDGSLVRGAAIALVVGVAVVAGLSSCALALLRTHAAGLLAGIAALFCWYTWCAILANEGAPTWRAASSLPLVAVLPGVVLGGAVAVAVSRGVGFAAPPDPHRSAPTEGLRAGERVS